MRTHMADACLDAHRDLRDLKILMANSGPLDHICTSACTESQPYLVSSLNQDFAPTMACQDRNSGCSLAKFECKSSSSAGRSACIKCSTSLCHCRDSKLKKGLGYQVRLVACSEAETCVQTAVCFGNTCVAAADTCLCSFLRGVHLAFRSR